ncbi:MAG: ATP-dependent sacrificial sulfur transferase LarE [bacterium]|nr:ATP-dependent sacrificial sulfur transferase LarE [bacterium]
MNNLNSLTKEEKLRNILSEYNSLAIAFSGGIDSTLLAYCANKFIEGKVLLINICSPFSTEKETVFINKWAGDSDFELEVIHKNPLDVPIIQENTKDRCYHCKKLLMSEIIEDARHHGINTVADGTNIDDFGDYRPGIKASDELSIRHPFIEAKFTKDDIRELAHKYNIPNWDLPSSACLASRIPYDTPILESDLRNIEKAEDFLHKLGFLSCRVRKLDDAAKIEVPIDRIDNLLIFRNEIIAICKNLDFKQVYIDLEGYRQGALNINI